MKRETIPIGDRGQWLAMRGRDVTASRVGALFDCHPFLSREQLAAQLRGQVARFDNAAMRAGRILEPGVAVAIGELHPDWRLVKATSYYRLPDLRLGATPDYLLGDAALLECKTASPEEWERWGDRPPLAYALQTLTQLVCADRCRGFIGCLIRELPDLPVHLFPVVRHPEAEGRLLAAVCAWWQALDQGELAPPADARGLAEMLLSFRVNLNCRAGATLSRSNTTAKSPLAPSLPSALAATACGALAAGRQVLASTGRMQ